MTVTTSFPHAATTILSTDLSLARPQAQPAAFPVFLRLMPQYQRREERECDGYQMYPTDATNCALNVWSDIISYWLGFWFRDYVCWSPWSSHREGKVHSFIFQEFSVIVKSLDWSCWQWRKWNSYPFHFSSCHGQCARCPMCPHKNPVLKVSHGRKNWCLKGNSHLSKHIISAISIAVLGRCEYS